MHRRGFLTAVATTAAALATTAARAAWPERRLTLVVPFAAGGSTDVAARLLAEKLGAELGQTIIVENRPGAGSNVGSASVAKAQPDGYTLLAATSTLAANTTLYKSMGFDFRKDLIPITEVTEIPNVLTVNKDIPAKTLPEFIAYVKANPGKVSYGSSGSGASQHLAAKLFEKMAGVEMVHVPYKGGSQAANDLIAGHIQVVFAPLVEVLTYIEAGTLRALGVTTKERAAKLPDVPAVSEVIPGFELVLWNGLFAPAGTPQPIIDRVADATRKVMTTPAVLKQVAEQGSKVVVTSPPEFKAFVTAEIDKWGELVKLSGAKID